MTTAEHTKTPYYVAVPTRPKTRDDDLDFGIRADVAGKKEIIAEVFGRVSKTEFPPARSTAEFMVLACNSHDALVEACKQAKGTLTGQVWGEDGEILDTQKMTLEKIDAALALAERSGS